MHSHHLRAGLALFNAERFFEAHEALEDAWRESPRHHAGRRHLQGLVQLAVAFHHHSTGNFVGAGSVLRRGRRNVEHAEESLPDIDFGKLRVALERWQEYLDRRAAIQAGQSAQGFEPQVRILSSHGEPSELPKIIYRNA